MSQPVNYIINYINQQHAVHLHIWKKSAYKKKKKTSTENLKIYKQEKRHVQQYFLAPTKEVICS